MGDRAQVLIKDENVYLYTHWGGTALENTVRDALALRERWDDSEYLARIIFCHMTDGSPVNDTTGFGIGGYEHGDIHTLITVNCADQVVTVRKTTQTVTYSFSEFIEQEVPR